MNEAALRPACHGYRPCSRQKAHTGSHWQVGKQAGRRLGASKEMGVGGCKQRKLGMWLAGKERCWESARWRDGGGHDIPPPWNHRVIPALVCFCSSPNSAQCVTQTHTDTHTSTLPQQANRHLKRRGFPEAIRATTGVPRQVRCGLPISLCKATDGLCFKVKAYRPSGLALQGGGRALPALKLIDAQQHARQPASEAPPLQRPTASNVFHRHILVIRELVLGLQP